MADCTLDSLIGAIRANEQIYEGPLFPEWKQQELFNNPESASSYARVLNKLMDKHRPNVNMDKATGGKGFWKAVNSFRTWESLIPDNVFKPIDTKMSKWDAKYQEVYGSQQRALQRRYEAKQKTIKNNFKGDAQKQKLKALESVIEQESDAIRTQAQKDYNRTVAKPLRQDLNNLKKMVEKYGVEGTILDKKLKQMGMDRNSLYFTHEYLQWLEKGGPYFTKSEGGVIENIINLLSTFTKNKVRYNVKIAAYNFLEVLQKAPTLGVGNTLKGTAKAVQAAADAGTTIFGHIPELENKGIYSNDFNPMRVDGKYDPVALSQNMLDNLGYYIGAEAGDANKGLKEIAYRPKPWNDAAVFSSGGSAKQMLGWMTFQTRHMQQYGGWAKTAFGPGKQSPEQRAQALQALATYSLMTGLLFGSEAAVPAPIWQVLDGLAKANSDGDENAESVWRQASEALLGDAGVLLDRGLINIATGGKVNMGKYAQPLGGIALGVTFDMVNNLGNMGPKFGKIMAQLAEENPAGAAMLAITTLAQFSQFHTKGLADPIVRASDAITNFVVEGHDMEDIYEYLPDEFIKKFLGRDALGKDEDAA